MTAASAAQLSDRSSRQRPDEPAGLQEGDRDPLPDGTTAGKPDPRIPARPDSDVARARASRPATALIWRDSFFFTRRSGRRRGPDDAAAAALDVAEGGARPGRLPRRTARTGQTAPGRFLRPARRRRGPDFL